MADITITLTEQAVQNIANMQRQVWNIQNEYGFKSDEALKASSSYLHALNTIFKWPGKVFAEDDLSLIITSSITVGVIWHPDKYMDGDSVWHSHALLGSWSCHS